MIPWECSVVFPNTQGNNVGQFKLDSDVQTLEYSYHFKDTSNGMTTWEREPKRQIEIMDPSRYKGQLGAQNSSLWKNTDRVFIVNGSVQKADGNFIGPFTLVQIPKIYLTIGSYPVFDTDILRIKQAGCTAILDIQTPGQYRMRALNQDKLRVLYERVGITKFVNMPVSDEQLQEYVQHLLEAAK